MKKTLVVKRLKLEQLPLWQKFTKENNIIHSAIKLSNKEIQAFLNFIKENEQFLPRFGSKGVENDPSWQQITTYNIFKQNDKYFFYLRNPREKKDSENRLDNKISCGVGGHIEPFDDNIMTAILREIEEEVDVIQEGQKIPITEVKLLGIIKSDVSEVSSVHLGLLTLVEVSDNVVIESSDDEMAEVFFATIPELKERIHAQNYVLEDWTNLVIKLLENIS